MVEWHHQCNGQELGQTPGDAEVQGSLTCSVAQKKAVNEKQRNKTDMGHIKSKQQNSRCKFNHINNYYYGLKICLPQNSYVGALIPMGKVFGGN